MVKISKKLITLVLILCLQFVDVCFGGVYTGINWKWKKSCKNHPFGIVPGVATEDKTIGQKCSLKFSYPSGMRSDLTNKDQMDEEGKAFCGKMYPDDLDGIPTWGNGNIICNYVRKSKCARPNAILIGSNCVTIMNEAMTFDGAKATCGGERLLSTTDKEKVIPFLIRLYQWPRENAATWGLDARLIYLGYSAVGDHLPGSSVATKDLTKKANVVCVGQAETATEGKEVHYCTMLKEFFNMNARNGTDEKTCYWSTVSVLGAQNLQSSQPNHFYTQCRARLGKLNYAVAPITTGQKNIINSFIQKHRKGKGDLVLPAVWMDRTQDKKKESANQFEASRFSYKLARMEIGSMTPFDMAVPYDIKTWEASYPMKATPGDVERRMLVWNKNGKIENVEPTRRSPVVCATGPLPLPKFCPDGWEVAHRADYSICFKAVNVGQCPNQALGSQGCANIGAQLAPVASPEEESAVVRAVNNIHPEGYSNRVMVGGDYRNGYKWMWDGEPIGEKYSYWHPGEPKRDGTPQCYGFFGERQGCIYEGCNALKIANGVTDGLMDGFCFNLCLNHFAGMNTIVCAKKAVGSDQVE